MSPGYTLSENVAFKYLSRKVSKMKYFLPLYQQNSEEYCAQKRSEIQGQQNFKKILGYKRYL